MPKKQLRKSDLATEHLLIRKGQKSKIQKLARKQGKRVSEVVQEMLVLYLEKTAVSA